MDRDAMELLQGTLDVLILRTLAWQPMHGYAVSRWIRATVAWVRSCVVPPAP